MAYSKKAFTIIELLVVIVIIGILAAVVIVSFSNVSSRGIVASLQSDLTSAKRQLLNFQTQSSTSSFPTAINCSSPSASEICIRPSGSNVFSYNAYNGGSAPSFYLTATNGTLTYQVNESGSPDLTSITNTNSLVLWLDSTNTASYSGSGTTWNDISGKGNNATMYGSVPLVTDVVPTFDFSSVTTSDITKPSPAASMGFTFASNMINRVGDFTISTWVKNPGSPSNQPALFSNAGAGDGYRFGVLASSVYYLIGPNYQEGSINFSSSLNSSLWYNVVAVYARTLSSATVYVYLNGVYQNSATIPYTQTIMQNSAPGIVRSACCSLYTGKLSSIMAHNRALTQSEVVQNYNAQKVKYGL